MSILVMLLLHKKMEFSLVMSFVPAVFCCHYSDMDCQNLLNFQVFVSTLTFWNSEVLIQVPVSFHEESSFHHFCRMAFCSLEP